MMADFLFSTVIRFSINWISMALFIIGFSVKAATITKEITSKYDSLLSNLKV